MSNTDPALPSIIVNGKPRLCDYPNRGNMRAHVDSILSGKAYPNIEYLEIQPKSVIDIGANIGATALMFLARFPNIKLTCYEPFPGNIKFLHKNVGSDPNVKIYPYGLGDSNRRDRLYLGNAQDMQHSTLISAEVSPEESIEVEIKDALEELRALDLSDSILKIDTEGCELEILRRLEPVLPRFIVIYLEFHSEYDRCTIDQLLLPAFSLWHARVQYCHRGEVAYVNRQIIDADKETAKWEIVNPRIRAN